jgi:hypothetical protein
MDSMASAFLPQRKKNERTFIPISFASAIDQAQPFFYGARIPGKFFIVGRYDLHRQNRESACW